MIVRVLVLVLLVAVIWARHQRFRALQTEDQIGIDGTALHRQHRCTGPDAGSDPQLHPVQIGRAEQLGTADQHQVSTGELVFKQRINRRGVIEAGVRQSLGLKSRWICHDRSVGQRLPIDDSHHAVNPGAAADLGPLKGFQQGLRQGKTTGFDQNAVQLIRPFQQRLHRWQEIILHRAAETAVGEFHKPAIQLLLIAEAAATEEIAIDSHFAELVHQHSQASLGVQQQMAEQGGLAGTEETGHHSHRQPPGVLHCHHDEAT